MIWEHGNDPPGTRYCGGRAGVVSLNGTTEGDTSRSAGTTKAGVGADQCSEDGQERAAPRREKKVAAVRYNSCQQKSKGVRLEGVTSIWHRQSGLAGTWLLAVLAALVVLPKGVELATGRRKQD